MNCKNFVKSEKEKERIKDLLSIIPQKASSVLDAGARDGFISIALTDYFNSVTALDLEKPDIPHNRIICVKGDITCLQFLDNSFDTVLCSEVLEHIPSHLLKKACNELKRVTRHYLIIGVPYKQDIRVGRTTCYICGAVNPPWGHVNIFDEKKLNILFPDLSCKKMSFVGENNDHTNFISALLMDLAGNPYGVHTQAANCIYCGSKLKIPPNRNLVQKICTKLAIYFNKFQSVFVKPHPNWINIVFKKITISALVVHEYLL